MESNTVLRLTSIRQVARVLTWCALPVFLHCVPRTGPGILQTRVPRTGMASPEASASIPAREVLLLRFDKTPSEESKDILRGDFGVELKGCVATNVYIGSAPSKVSVELSKKFNIEIFSLHPIKDQGPDIPVLISPRYEKINSGAKVDHRVLLRLGAYRFDPLSEFPVLDSSLCVEPPQGLAYYIVQFYRLPTKRDRMELGLSLDQYVPDFGYLERISRNRASELRESKLVRRVEFLQPAFKIDPSLRSSLSGKLQTGVWVSHFQNADLNKFLSEPESAVEGLEKLSVTKIRFLSLDDLKIIAKMPDVTRIEKEGEPQLRNATTSWVIQSNLLNKRSIHDHGLRGNGQIIGLIDDWVDLNHCFFEDSQPFGPLHRKFISYPSASDPANSQEPSTHGTFVAGVLAGESLADPKFPGNGQAPEAKIAFAWWEDATGSGAGPSNFLLALKKQYDDGARIFSNSWGDDSTTDYTHWSYDADLFSWTHEDALIVFAASNERTVRTPENAKDVLAVGASAQATLQDLVGSGGKGPTLDPHKKRRKPEIFAPGCDIYSAKVGSDCEVVKSKYESTCATSWACPAIAGAAALVREYFVDGWYPKGLKGGSAGFQPTGALIKAVLLNGTVDMRFQINQGQGVNQYPSDEEGWGRLLLENSLFFDHDSRRMFLRDIHNSEGLESGERKCWRFRIMNESEPLKVTLVWTERPPAQTVHQDPVINDLNLVVVGPSSRYIGNDFDKGALSSFSRGPTSGIFDDANNVEQVVVGVPKTGEYEAIIEGASIAVGPQGFALVVTGGVEEIGSECK